MKNATKITYAGAGSSLLRWLMVPVAILAVSLGVMAWSAHAQQEPPPGYLGPMKPVPSGPAAPRPAGEVTILAGPALPNVRVNDKVDDAPDQTQSETSIAVDPTNPLRLIGAFNDCRGFFVPSRNGISGWGFSLDGGSTWNPVQTGLPKGAPGDFGARGDPSVDVDADGNFYYASLYSRVAGGGTPINVSVHKGRFSGSTFTWNTPTFPTNFTSGFGSDKVMLGVDHRPGNTTVYVTYTNFNAGGNGQVEIVRSTDGGATWGAPVVIAPASGVVHQGSIPRVGPDGEIYVAWEDGFAQPTRSIHIRKSTAWPDFGPDITISSVTPPVNPPFNSRNNDFPTMDVDRSNGSNRGRVYVAWNDGRSGGPGAIGAILLSHSADGTTWSAPAMVNDDGLPSDTGTHHWFGWLAVDVRGVANIGFYDRRLRGSRADLTDAFATTFTPAGGVGANTRLTNQSFSMNVPSRCTPNFGDYNGAAAGPTRFHFLYGDGREGNPDTFSAGVTTSPLLVNPSSVEACRPTPTTTTLTLLGGTGLFENDVTLSLMSVNPPPPAGGQITADFNPNPVPRPPATGSTSTMTIRSTDTTPPNSYVLTVSGSDGARTETTTVTLQVRSQVPDSPSLLNPPDGTDGVVETAAFGWTATDQATSYRLQVFAGEGCNGNPIRDFSNIGGTIFTVPQAQALPFFQTLSWTVIAANSCGASPIVQCSSFRTRSCSTFPQSIAINGGFEQDLTGWVVDASVPPPVVTTERPHSGAKAVKLGNILPPGTPTDFGNSEIHQTYTLPAGAVGAKLTFWFWPQSFDSVQFDQQEVFVRPINPPGPDVTLMREANNAQTYLQREFSLDAFRGMTFEIHFRVHDDAAPDPTGMFVDDVSVTFLSCGGPDFFLTSTAPTFNEVCAGNAIPFTVGVQSLNGPNFTSPVQLTAVNLPPGATATFAQNPVLPGNSTTLTVSTTRPITGGPRSFSVVGEAVEPPPTDLRETMISTLISANPPESPEEITPTPGQLNVPRRPTLSWTAPPVQDSIQPNGTAPQSAATSGGYSDLTLEQMVANEPPLVWPKPQPDGPNGLSSPNGDPGINGFGAARYRVQVSPDSDFSRLPVNLEVPDTTLSLSADLDIATKYFWHVNATNACGTSAYSASGTFITGACFEGWAVNPPVPITNGPSQASAVGFGGKIYVIGGGVGPGPDTRINQVWEFDPATNAWTRKADIPTPGPGSSYGSAAELGGRIYVFGGVAGPPGPITILNTLWIYDIAANTWRRGRDLPVGNFGAAVAAIGSKFYLAYGSGFGTQTWQYDPATDTYTRKADAPGIPAPFRVHGTAIGNEMHAFAGGFNGTAHVVYNASTDTWRTAPPIPFGVTDPAVATLGGKLYVAGGRPLARLQAFDPATNTWSQGPSLVGLPTGIDNTSGAALGFKLFVVGGFDGTNGSNAHRVFALCGDTSAQSIPFAVDGDGTVSGIANEGTSLILSNDTSGATVQATVFFDTPDGTADSSRVFSLAPRETKVLTDIIRQVRGASGVQNARGSLTILATQSINALASVVNNDSADPAIVDGQRLAGITNGFVPAIQLNNMYRTQVVLNNTSGRTASAQLLAYPAGGGDTPVAATSVNVPPHGQVDFPDIVSALGLVQGYSGQLTWNSTQPLAVFTRNVTQDGRLSGAAPVHSLNDGSGTLLIAYVEDSSFFSTSLQLNNTGSITADVNVRFVAIRDTTGGTAGDSSSRDIAVRVNSATSIPNIIRWVLRSTSTDPIGSQGFLVITSAQPITASATLVNNFSSDPATTDAAVVMRNGFVPISIPGSPFVAISNPGATTASVSVMAFSADGTPAVGAPLSLNVVGSGQYSTNDIVAALGLAAGFSGSLTITSDTAVLVLNLTSTDNNGGVVVPVHPR